MPLSIPTRVHKFLLDENVRIELFKFLKENTSDVKFCPKGASDKQVATISKQEHRVLVTNDYDFAKSTKDQVFAVIWLRIPQSDAKVLIESFKKLTGEIQEFSEKLVVLYPNKWEDFPLGIGEVLEFEKLKLPAHKWS